MYFDDYYRDLYVKRLHTAVLNFRYGQIQEDGMGVTFKDEVEAAEELAKKEKDMSEENKRLREMVAKLEATIYIMNAERI